MGYKYTIGDKVHVKESSLMGEVKNRGFYLMGFVPLQLFPRYYDVTIQEEHVAGSGPEVNIATVRYSENSLENLTPVLEERIRRKRK